MTHPDQRRVPGLPVSTMLLLGIFLILLTTALRFGAGLLLPIAIAILFTFLLAPAVRLLRRLGLSAGVAAGLLVFGAVAVVGTSVVLLAGPAATWVETTPRTLVKVQSRIRKLLRPIQETANKVDQVTGAAAQGDQHTVQIQAPGLLERLSISTGSIAATVVTVVFLTYFLLAMLPVFRKKLADLIETRAGVKHVETVLTEIESQMSRYMLINTMTSVGVGTATGVLVAVVGLPNPLLWAVLALLLNYIPYAGALISVVLIGAVALVTFNTMGPVVLVVIGCVTINTLEGHLITPHLLGRYLPLNPVAIFVSLLYWGWVWGVVGALLAVPITVMLQVISSHVDRLHPLAVLLES